jgi:hypothetical protein
VWMTEPQARAIDALCKLIATVGLVAGGGWSLITYLLGRKDQAKTAAIEAKKPFNEKRLDRYIQAVFAAATIATSTNQAEIDSAKQRFWNLYWGELALFEDRNVESAMVKLGEALESGRAGHDLRGLALALAHACRDSLGDSWSVDVSKSSIEEKFGLSNDRPS